MNLQFSGVRTKLGKRWPYKLLNVLSSSYQARFLEWKSGGRQSNNTFDLAQVIRTSRAILFVLPDQPEEFMITLPLVQGFLNSLPDKQIGLLTPITWIDFLSGSLPGAQLIGLNSQDFYYGEDHLQVLRSQIAALNPEIIINLNRYPHPLLRYLLKTTRAEVRVELTSDPAQPFANLGLSSVEPYNLLRHIQLATKLFSFGGSAINCNYNPFPVRDSVAADIKTSLKSKGIHLRKYWIFLWGESRFSLQMKLLESLKRSLALEKPGQSLLLISLVGGYHPPTIPVDLGREFTCLEAPDPESLLGYCHQASGIYGLNGFLLHLASLSQSPVTGYFSLTDAPYDTSAMNPRIKVRYSGMEEDELANPNRVPGIYK